MMTDWESLLDSLDDFVKDSDISELQIPDPVDLATAKKRYNIFKLKCVVKVLNQYLEPTNTVSIRQLASRVLMPEDEFRKHLTKHSFFKSCEEKKWTYSRAVMQLKQDELSIIRARTMKELEKLNAGRAIRKRTLNDYSTGKKLIQQLRRQDMLLCGVSLCSVEFWLEDSNGSGISKLAQLGRVKFETFVI